MKISVIGGGSWGTALGIALANKGHEVYMLLRSEEQRDRIKATGINEKYLPGVKLPPNMVFTLDKVTACEDTNLILFAVPAQSFKDVALSLKTLITDDIIIVNVAKGIEITTLKLISQISEEIFPKNSYVDLSGPSHAEEVCKGLPTTLVAASKDRLSAEYVQDLFSSERLRVYTNPDVIGVEVGGALKNIIAIGAGISDGLGYGDNAKAALMTRGIKEISQLGLALGADLQTFAGLTGIGDLIVTCTSQHSRNRRCGILIGQGLSLEEAIDSIGMVVEGAFTVKAAYVLSKQLEISMPITSELYGVLYEQADVRSSTTALMMRSKKHELEDIISINDQW